MCSKISTLLQGKHKPTFKNNLGSTGDICIVVNSSRLLLTRDKYRWKDIKYHTGYVGHLRSLKFNELIFQKPELIITWCVNKMLPKNQLREERLSKLFVFRGPEHHLKGFIPTFTEREPLDKQKIIREAGIYFEDY
jgi:large subunit ribosomal protein L13